MAKIQIGTTTLNSGAKGEQGIQGTNGDDGLSAYEIAVSNGFVGNETAWLASLQGEQGVQGIQGEQGIQGIQGLTGAAGSGAAKLVFLSIHREDGRNSIDLVNKLISIYSYSSYILFSDDYATATITTDFILDYSAFTTNRWVYLTYNRTKSQFEITDNVTGLQYPADNNYYVTSFYNNSTTETVALPLNNNAFVVKENNSYRHEPVNWTALGDSHTDGIADYPAVVLDYFSTSPDFTDAFFNLTNLGLSGSRVYNDGANSFYQRRTQIPATTDLLTIFGGHNDQGAGATIGTIATSSFDDTTFIGAYQAIIEYAYSLNPEMRILLVIPHRAFSSGVQRDMSAYNQAIKDVAEYYALPILDLSETMGINVINQSSYLVDQLHYNSYGIKVAGKLIYNFIKEKY